MDYDANRAAVLASIGSLDPKQLLELFAVERRAQELRAEIIALERARRFAVADVLNITVDELLALTSSTATAEVEH